MKQKDVKSYLVRGLAVVIGIFMVGIAVGFFKIAEMGADPFTAMNTGISSMLSIQFGTLQLGVNALILVLVFAFKRQFIGFGTIFNMVFVGYTADFIMWILAKADYVRHMAFSDRSADFCSTFNLYWRRTLYLGRYGNGAL